MHELEREGVRLAWTEEGAGPAVLLVHGHTLDHRVWELVVPGLVAAGLRVVRVDLRGHGASSRPESGYHWSHHAADMVAVLDAAGVEAAAVVGFSLGGGVALELVLDHPARVRELALLAPVMPDRPFEPAFLDNLKRVARVARADGIRAAMLGPWLESPLFEVSLGSPGVRDRLLEMVAAFPGAEYLATARDDVERPLAVPERLAEITAPTLVVVGEREMPGFRSFADEAAQGIAGARLEVIPDCGHLLPLEAPERLLGCLVGHLGGA